MGKGRAYYTADEKVNIIRKHLLEKVSISDLCEQHKLQPTVFYRWQKQFFERGARTFDGERKHNDRSQEEKILALEQKLRLFLNNCLFNLRRIVKLTKKFSN